MAITNKDIEKLREHFATKDDLKQLENKVITRLDKVMGELEKAREDRIFAKAKDDEQDNKIEKLDQRLKKVEAKVGV